MKSLPRYRQLPPRRRKLLRQAFLLTAFARLLVSVASIKTTRRLLPLAARTLKSQPTSSQLEDEVWAINAASTVVPRSTCLVKALALHTLLARYGEPTQLHVGVTKDKNNQLLAHAWVQQDSRILVGGDEAGSYNTLLKL